MFLCIDIGNTRIKWAVYDGNDMVHYEVFERGFERRLDNLLEKYDISQSISSSTRKRARTFQDSVAERLPHIILSHETSIPIINAYETPETLGRDRLAGVVAAYGKKKNENSLVIDAGTCITYDFIDQDGVYHGGNIAPGVYMRLEAMHHFTDGLPLIDREMPEGLLGVSTKTAMQNGAVRGTLLEIQSFIEAIELRYGTVNVFLTGGDADFFGEKLNSEIFVAPKLILEGLNEILKHNA